MLKLRVTTKNTEDIRNLFTITKFTIMKKSVDKLTLVTNCSAYLNILWGWRLRGIVRRRVQSSTWKKTVPPKEPIPN